MKLFITHLFMLLIFFPGLASCSTDKPESPPQTEQPIEPAIPSAPNKPNDDENNNNHNNSVSNKLNIRIGSSAFTVTLEDNAPAKAFKALLPLTLDMAELNGNEKYFNLSANLPTATMRPATIRIGDLMLYGSNTLVLFYETFSSAYSYTRIGSVDNPSGFADALGSTNVTVTFEADSNNKTKEKNRETIIFK